MLWIILIVTWSSMAGKMTQIKWILSKTRNIVKSKRSRDDDLYYCDLHSVKYITKTGSNAKDNIYFVIVFLELLPNIRFSLVL